MIFSIPNNTFSILIIEDNPGDVRLIYEYLKNSNLSNSTTHVSELFFLALEYLEAHKPNIILLDMGLPDSNGIDSVIALNKKYPEIPVIILTGLADEKVIAESLQHYAQDYLIKGDLTSNLLSRSIRYAIQRKGAEQKMIRDRSYYKNLVETLIEGIIIHHNGTILYANPSAASILAASSPEQIMGIQFLDIVNTDFHKKANQQIAEVKATQKSTSNIEELFVRFDKKIIPVEVNTSPIEYEEQDCIMVVFKDISRRKAIEKHQRLQSKVLEATANSIVITNPQGDIIWANPAFTLLTGYTLEEAAGKNPRFLKSGKQNRSFYTELWNAISNGKIWKGELENKRKDGMLYTEEMTITPVCDAYGKIEHFVAVKQDVSYRIQMLAELKESETKYRLIAEKTTDVIWLMDLQGKSLYVSPSIKRFTDFTVEEYLQQSIATRFSPKSAQRALQLFSKELSISNQPDKLENYSISTELEYVCKNGNTKWGELVITPFFNDNNVLIGIHGVTRDVTEIRKVKTRELNYLLNISKLSEIVMDAINLSNGSNIFELIANQLKEFIPKSMIITNSFNAETMLFKTEAIKGFSPDRIEEIETFVKNFSSENFISTAEMFTTLFSGKLEKAHEGIYQITMHQIPKPICKEIETNLGIKECYSIGIVNETKLLGSILILNMKEKLPIEKELIEIYTFQISSVIMKRDTENALRRSEEQFRILYEQAPIPYQSIDDDGRILNVNQAWLNELKYKRAEVIGKWFGSFLVAEDALIFKERFPTIKVKTIIKNIEYQMVRSDQSIILVSYDGRVIHDKNGNFLMTHAVFKNITESRRLFNALHESEEQYRELFNKANDLIFTLDFDGNFKSYNVAAADLIVLDTAKRSDKNFVMNFRDILDDDEYEKAVGQRTLKLEGKKDFTMYEVQIKNSNGQKYDLEINSSIRYKDNKPFEIFAIARNITEKKEMLRKLEYNYDMQIAVSAILNLSHTDIPMHELLLKSLEIIFKLNWLNSKKTGCIFLINEENKLDLIADINLPDGIKEQCKTIEFNHCICGRVAKTQQIEYIDSSIHKHDIKLESLKSHGHYAVPLVMNSKTLGVINIYLSTAHIENITEQESLKVIANAISNVIVRKQSAQAILNANTMLESIVKTRTEQLENLNKQLTEDIKLQQKQKELLQYSENLNKSTLNSINDMIALINKDLSILMVNKAFELQCNRIFGCNEFVGKPVGEVIKFFNPTHTDKCKEVFKNGEIIDLNETLNFKNSTMFVEIKLIPIILNNTTNRVVILIHNITKQKQSELEILKNLEKERELHLLKSRFVSVISHEFRTPLAGIQSSVELFQRYGHKWDDKRKLELYESIYNNIRYTNLLLDDVSLINKEDEGNIRVSFTNVNIGKVCKQSISDVLATYKNRKINFQIEPNEIIFHTDEHLLRHILNNILTNAAKYSNEETEISLDVVLKENNLNIIISDHGIGIPPEELKFAFEPFHRASNVEGIKGTGLGLSIVKRSTSLLGGNVSLKSVLKKGTEVKVEIPFTEK